MDRVSLKLYENYLTSPPLIVVSAVDIDQFRPQDMFQTASKDSLDDGKAVNKDPEWLDSHLYSPAMV